MKQVNLFGQEFAPKQDEQKYSSKIEAPIYEPKNAKPHLMELCDKGKTHRLMREIDMSNLPIEEKNFLMDAARRHNALPLCVWAGLEALRCQPAPMPN